MLSGEVEEWLLECHRQSDIRREVVSHFARIFDLLQDGGPAIGDPYVRKVHGQRLSWEIRVGHRTGAYRLFFGVEANIIAVAWGLRKNSGKFPPRTYDLAEQKIEQFVRNLTGQEGEQR